MPKKRNSFSEFIRNASPEEKAEVYGRVLEKATKAQKLKMPSLKSLGDKAWKLMSELSRRGRADYRGYAVCISCGVIKMWKEMDAGHWLHGGRGGKLKRVTYDPRNIHPQCSNCNRHGHNRYARSDSSAFYTARMVNMYGPEVVEELKALKRQPAFTYVEMLDKVEELKRLVSEL